MRWSLALVLSMAAVSSVSAVSAKPSNPAFLGVGMVDTGAACQITQVTAKSPAELAGLRQHDELVSIDGTPIPTCNALLAKIQTHVSGDTIDIAIRRGNTTPSLKATLMTREEVLRRRGIVGQPVLATSLLGVDKASVDLSDAQKQTTIVGWFDTNCGDCTSVFSTVARWSTRNSKKGSPIRVFGIVGDDRNTQEQALEDMKLKQRSFDVPLLLTDPETRDSMTLADGERVYFMVIDHRGVVQHVAPIAPGSEDAEAMLDELFATAEQCARKLK